MTEQSQTEQRNIDLSPLAGLTGSGAVGMPKLAHIYARPPRPGDRAICGHRWTPDEAEAVWHGNSMDICMECCL